MAVPQVSVSRQRGSSALCSYIVVAMVLLQLIAGVSARRRGLQEGGEADVYCVAKPEAETAKLQEALDWACGEGSNLGSVDCSAIQQGGTCFEPDTLQGHASYAFTLYYSQQSAASHACDFKGLATLTYSNPSSGTCIYPSTTQIISNTANSSISSPPVGGDALPFFLMSPAPSPNGATSHRSLLFGSLSLLGMLPLLIMFW